jgi:DNA-binding transcriptional MerR regulator
MRIGQLAALAGVSTRAVRHYHRLGLLPEPKRRANGYREYTLREAVTLARIRRLSELGLSLGEIRDVLDDDRGRELREVLTELDADLARQEAAIGARRARLAALLSRAELHPDDAVSPDMAAVLGRLPPAEGGMAMRDREWLALLDTTLDDRDRPDLVASLMRVPEPDEAYTARVQEVFSELDALAGTDLDEDDPRIDELARRLIELTPPALLPTGEFRVPEESDAFMRAFLADLPPAQALVVSRVIELLAGS